jgi:sodium/potassium-transporting ATPase subunit alpha
VSDSQAVKPATAPQKGAHKELAELDWHILPKDEVLQRLNVNPELGLDETIAKKRLSQNGPNEVKPHKPNIFLKIAGWLFGGFGTILFVAAILVFIAWYVSTSVELTIGALSEIPILLRQILLSQSSWYWLCSSRLPL